VARYALTILLSAFLLFQVQPLISKYILPWFGGTPAVWTTCMLFFQVLLLAGYAYAHVVATRLRQRRQVVLHLVVLAAAAATLPIAPSARWKPLGGEDPTWHILLLLAVSVGVPYFVLATTSPLLQAWFSRTHPSRRAYRLYALSNAGSLLALVTFPFVVEPRWSSPVQAAWWSAAFLGFAGLCALCALRTWNVSFAPAKAKAGDEAAAERPGLLRRLMWLLLAACGSVLLLAVTNQMSQDVAVVPFLWVLPLSLYLLTFIICFENERWYIRPIFWLWLVGAMISMTALLRQGVEASIQVQVLGFSLGLFGCCMVFHGELVRLKPHPRYLTHFYLMVSAGGALGGVFVSLIAPMIFDVYLELHLGMWACCALALVAFWMEKRPYQAWPRAWAWRAAIVAYLLAPGVILSIEWLADPETLSNPVSPAVMLSIWGLLGAIAFSVWQVRRRPVLWRWSWVWSLTLPAVTVALFFLARALHAHVDEVVADSEHVSRNFYGMLRVTEYGSGTEQHRLTLRHGRISHGSQLCSQEGCTRPTTYYGEDSGVGLAIRHHPRRGAGLHVGVVGLGTGTIAAYGQPSERYRFYEINPDIHHLATTTFTYLPNCEGEVTVVLGDARLSMERELQHGEVQGFDVLALDAFSGDAIPVHLLTQEAFELYLRHLRPDGVIAVHISNRYLELEPVVWAIADRLGLQTALIEASGDDDLSTDASSWVLVSADAGFLALDPIAEATTETEPEDRRTLLWTDTYSNLFRILK
jgi:hypothetical protein